MTKQYLSALPYDESDHTREAKGDQLYRRPKFDPRVVLDSFQYPATHPQGRLTWYRATNPLGTVYITDNYRDAVVWVNS